MFWCQKNCDELSASTRLSIKICVLTLEKCIIWWGLCKISLRLGIELKSMWKIGLLFTDRVVMGKNYGMDYGSKSGNSYWKAGL